MIVTFGPLVHWSLGPLVHWSIGPLVHCKKTVGIIVEGHQLDCDKFNQDGAVYKGDVEDLCGVSDGRKKENLLEGDFSLVEVPSQGTDSLNFSLEQVHPLLCILYPSFPSGG